MKRTTPSDSPLHRERAQRENCSHATMQRLLPLPKGRAMDAPKHRDAILPLCKGELEGVVAASAPCGWNLKSKIQNHKSQII